MVGGGDWAPAPASLPLIVIRPFAFDHDLDRLPTWLDFDLEMHADGDTKGVETGTEVGYRRRNANLHRSGHLALRAGLAENH